MMRQLVLVALLALSALAVSASMASLEAELAAVEAGVSAASIEWITPSFVEQSAEAERSSALQEHAAQQLAAAMTQNNPKQRKQKKQKQPKQQRKQKKQQKRSKQQKPKQQKRKKQPKQQRKQQRKQQPKQQQKQQQKKQQAPRALGSAGPAAPHAQARQPQAPKSQAKQAPKAQARKPQPRAQARQPQTKQAPRAPARKPQPRPAAVPHHAPKALGSGMPAQHQALQAQARPVAAQPAAEMGWPAQKVAWEQPMPMNVDHRDHRRVHVTVAANHIDIAHEYARHSNGVQVNEHTKAAALHDKASELHRKADWDVDFIEPAILASNKAYSKTRSLLRRTKPVNMVPREVQPNKEAEEAVRQVIHIQNNQPSLAPEALEARQHARDLGKDFYM